MSKLLLCLVAAAYWSVVQSSVLIDSSATLQVKKIPDKYVIGGDEAGPVITIVYSPGTPSTLIDNNVITKSDLALSLEDENKSDNGIVLMCRGATLSGASEAEQISLGTCSLVSDVVLVDGVTAGDVENGLKISRHGRTLLSLFRARLLEPELSLSSARQTLMLGLIGDNILEERVSEQDISNDVQELFKIAVAESKKMEVGSFEQLYDFRVVFVSSVENAKDAITSAKDAVRVRGTLREAMSLSSAMVRAHTHMKDLKFASASMDPPLLASAYISIGSAFNKHSRTLRASIVAWKGRSARGLWADGFGRDADALRERILGGFDSDTLFTAGLPLVASYRLQLRSQLQSLVDTSIEESFKEQISNLEKSTLKRFEAQLLRTVHDSAESLVDTNAAALRTETYNFEAVANDLEVASLGLTKEKVVRQMSSKLNDALMAFPDSPAAKLKRAKKVETIVKKEKKPSQRAVGFGLDLVAVLRPDGFGSFQGFAGYQLGGNSITFGIHNDADDPQVIAQFGGVRPPLLRVQPKLRVDVEL